MHTQIILGTYRNLQLIFYEKAVQSSRSASPQPAPGFRHPAGCEHTLRSGFRMRSCSPTLSAGSACRTCTRRPFRSDMSRFSGFRPCHRHSLHSVHSGDTLLNSVFFPKLPCLISFLCQGDELSKVSPELRVSNSEPGVVSLLMTNRRSANAAAAFSIRIIKTSVNAFNFFMIPSFLFFYCNFPKSKSYAPEERSFAALRKIGLSGLHFRTPFLSLHLRLCLLAGGWVEALRNPPLLPMPMMIFVGEWCLPIGAMLGSASPHPPYNQ